MADVTHGQTKVYKKQGGDELVVASGGTITVESGGAVTVASGGSITGGLLDLLEDLPTSNVASPGIWNDNGVLKVGTA